MIFNQPAYFLLLAMAVVVFRLLPPAAKPWWLFLSGLAFYAYFSPTFVALLVTESVMVFVLGGMVRGSAPRSGFAFAAGLALTIGVLAIYKYGGLMVSTVAATGASLPTFEDVRLPLAISFFTFEFVHYLVDARRGELAEHSSADFLAFTFFVPTMVAGPIKRFQGFSQQVAAAKASAADVDTGVRRILIGLLKKIVLADSLVLWTTPLTTSGALADASRLDIIVALVAYAFMIYLDFSGYSDIAIGSARLFGIEVPENFRWPYTRTNIADFWRSWHVSLTRWITDYVYVPLGGNRCTLSRQCGNVVAAMAISGIWHGAAWNFLGWGLYHGVLLAGYRVWRLWLRPSSEATDRTLAWPVRVMSGALTFSLVTIGWGLFAMPFSRFVEMLGRLAGG